MKRFLSVFLLLLLFGITDLCAQQSFKEDTLFSKEQRSSLASMPIYNPKNIDAKLRIWKPEGLIFNMPVIGDRGKGDSEYLSPNLGKNLFQKGPGNIPKDEKADSTEQK